MMECPKMPVSVRSSKEGKEIESRSSGVTGHAGFHDMRRRLQAGKSPSSLAYWREHSHFEVPYGTC